MDLVVESSSLAGGRRGPLAPAFLQSEGKEVAAPGCWNSLLCKVDSTKAKAFSVCRTIPQQMFSFYRKGDARGLNRFPDKSHVTLNQKLDFLRDRY